MLFFSRKQNGLGIPNKDFQPQFVYGHYFIFELFPLVIKEITFYTFTWFFTRQSSIWTIVDIWLDVLGGSGARRKKKNDTQYAIC